MYTHAEKSHEYKNRSVANEVSQRQRGGDSTFQFLNNHPEAIAQSKLQEMANHSPRVKQLKAMQEMANHSPQAQQLMAMQERANHRTQAKQPALHPEFNAQKESSRRPPSTFNNPIQAKFTRDAQGRYFDDFLGSYIERISTIEGYAPWQEFYQEAEKSWWIYMPATDYRQEKYVRYTPYLDLDELKEIDELEREGHDELKGTEEEDERKERSAQNLQEMLNEEYWKNKLIGADEGEGDLYKKTLLPDYWTNYEFKAARKARLSREEPKRKIEDILNTVGPKLLEDIQAAGKESSGQLKLYRTMPNEEADAIMDWYQGKKQSTEEMVRGKKVTAKEFRTNKDVGAMPVEGHLGDREQAETYYQKGENALMEFTLKPGAHVLLFDPKYMALARRGKGVTSLIAEYEKQKTGRIFTEASLAEGNLAGYIGMKSERRGAFSLTMGDSEATHLLFQLFVESIRKVD